MRRASLVTVAGLALLAPMAARADVQRFQGEARIDLYERLDHHDAHQVAITVVDLSIELHGAPGIALPGDAVGTATIGRDDGSTTTIALAGFADPPRGSGGLVHVAGLGDDDSLYCFRIWDLVDAPTPRPDRLVAAFEPLDRFSEGFAERPSSPALFDICHALDHRLSPPHSGDFWFSAIL